MIAGRISIIADEMRKMMEAEEGGKDKSNDGAAMADNKDATTKDAKP